MDSEPPTTEQLLEAVVSSTRRLASSITSLDDREVRGACRLPGWTRGHLLSHLARNADGLRLAILSVRSGEMIPMYSSSAARDADIEAGASRPTGVIIDDFTLSARAFATEAQLVHSNQWQSLTQLSTVTGPSAVPAGSILEMRLREVEIHHVDLRVGYDFSSAPGATLDWLLDYAAHRLDRLGPHHLTLIASDTGRSYTALPNHTTTRKHIAEAPASDLLMYLTGRSDRNGSFGLPEPPAWG